MSKEMHVPEWLLERYLLDELPRKKRRLLEEQLKRDPALRAELEKLRRSDRQILATYPADRVIPELMKRAALAKPEPAAPRPWRLAWMAVPAAVLVLFLLVILPPVLQRRLAVSENSRPENYIGTKGSGPISGPLLQLYRKSGGADEILRNGDQARAGDLLQIAYVPGGQTHGVILSIDGAGSVILHFPEKTEGDSALPSSRKVFLANAYELDQAPLFERFFFITAKEPLSTAAILEKAGELAADKDKAETAGLDLPGRFGQFSLLIRK
ncbi:MAG: hypothetical protein MUP71_12430 [Candidatus Aminicenantes bacterium]|nr:hypothetical protein [Candidatus Aminicenantes bacterium]